MTHTNLDGGRWVTDGGLETDLIYHHGADLPQFAAFPLVLDDEGAGLLERYYGEYAEIAAAAGAGLMLEAPTWRANPDWGEVLGYDAAALDAANRAAIDLLHRVRQRVGQSSGLDRVLVSGVVGPRGDGYVAAGADADQVADYHAPQLASFAAAGADYVHAMTVNEPAEAIGVVRGARGAGLPVTVSFTVETDGRLADGTSLSEAIGQVEATGGADWYGVNCAHPTHVARALDGADWQRRVTTLRPNASTLSHAELDVMEELDAGDLDLLVSSFQTLRDALGDVQAWGGCCGTDARHVAALWDVTA